MTKTESRFDWYGFSMLVAGATLASLWWFAYTAAPNPAQATMRTQYPGEEKIATTACRQQNQKLMYWWLEDPRKAGATMHVRCTGQVTVVTEVKF